VSFAIFIGLLAGLDVRARLRGRVSVFM